MTRKNSEIQSDHQNRINRVFKFIEENLDTKLSLNRISEVAHFSPYHFHRVFKFITGETLNEYVTRQRIEKSALDILHKNLTIAEIAYKYGFSENPSFTRTFKKYFGVSPTEFEKQNPNRYSKIRQLNSKNGQEYPDHDKYICVINNLKKWIKMNAKIEVKELKKMDLAYVPCIGSHNLSSAFEKLIQWATPQGLMNDQTKMVTVYHDSFKVTQANKVRMSASILLNEKVEIKGEIGLATLQGGKFIVGRYEIEANEFEKSWTGLFLWMNENGYTKADREPFEIYYNNFNEHPQRKATVDFCIPVQ